MLLRRTPPGCGSTSRSAAAVSASPARPRRCGPRCGVRGLPPPPPASRSTSGTRPVAIGSRAPPGSARSTPSCRTCWACRPSSSTRSSCCRRASSPASCTAMPVSAPSCCNGCSAPIVSAGSRSGWPSSAARPRRLATRRAMRSGAWSPGWLRLLASMSRPRFRSPPGRMRWSSGRAVRSVTPRLPRIGRVPTMRAPSGSRSPWPIWRGGGSATRAFWPGSRRWRSQRAWSRQRCGSWKRRTAPRGSAPSSTLLCAASSAWCRPGRRSPQRGGCCRPPSTPHRPQSSQSRPMRRVSLSVVWSRRRSSSGRCKRRLGSRSRWPAGSSAGAPAWRSSPCCRTRRPRRSRRLPSRWPQREQRPSSCRTRASSPSAPPRR